MNEENDDETRPPLDLIIHDVIWGDTLSKISLEYGVSVDEIAEFNLIRNVNLIYSGSSLQIPGVLDKINN